MRVTLQYTSGTLDLDLSPGVTLVDERTLDVPVPAWLRDDELPQTMPIEAWQILDLHRLGDVAGLAEIGLAVVGASQDGEPSLRQDAARREFGCTQPDE